MSRFVFIIFCLIIAPTLLAQESSVQVWAIYATDWANETAWDGATLEDQPLIGQYNSQHEHTLNIQLQQAALADIDAFVLRWRGGDDRSGMAVIRMMLEQMKAHNFRLGVVYELPENATYETAQVAITWLEETLLPHPSALQWEAKPILIVKDPHQRLETVDWRRLHKQFDLMNEWVWLMVGDVACCWHGGVTDGMISLNTSSDFRSERRQLENRDALYIPTISPDHNQPTQLVTNWENARRIEPMVILIDSWNDYVENTHIEPSLLHGTAAIDALQEPITIWKQDHVVVTVSEENDEASSLPITGQYVNPSTTVNVRAGAGTEFETLGQAYSRLTYNYIREENGWYALDYNGQLGWVSSEYARITDTPNAVVSAPSTTTSNIPTVPISENAVVIPTVDFGDVVNVRVGPGTGYAIIEKAGSTVSYPYLGQEGGWYIVDARGHRGYIAAEFARIENR